jgi:nicotinamide mononucleotide transporter
VTDPLEIGANALACVSILLAGRNSVHTWWVGILGCVLFTAVFFQARLYADATLQVFFVVTSAIGWWQWLHGSGASAPLPVTRAPRRVLLLSAIGGVIGGLGYGALLHVWTDAHAPFLDSLVLSFSVVAQLLLMRRHLETWPVWLLVNSLAMPLFASRGLYVTAGLYAVYGINAVVAWRHWRGLRA